MQNMMQRVLNRKGFTLVELMIVVAIIGILAAIAIPAFLRSVKKSKTAEAEGMMKKMAEGSKAYFTSEQKGSVDAGTGGIEPWHEGDAAPGMPVAWGLYTFPGGDDCVLVSTTAAPPQGGSKQAANPEGTGGCAGLGLTQGTAAYYTLNKFGITLKDPVYFKYTYTTGGAGDMSTAVITSVANFDTGATNDHTITQNLSISPDQEVLIAPPVVTYEFQ